MSRTATRRPAVVFSSHIVCSCGRAMGEIASFAIEDHRSRVPLEKETHEGPSELKNILRSSYD